MTSIGRSINILFRCSQAYRANNLEGTGISASLYFYILSVCKHPGISQEELTKLLYINKSSVARAIQSLEADGFIKKIQDPNDKRIFLVYPTKKAEGILPEIRKISEDWQDFLLSSMTDEEKEQFATLLEKATGRAMSYVDTREEQE